MQGHMGNMFPSSTHALTSLACVSVAVGWSEPQTAPWAGPGNCLAMTQF